MQPLEWLKHFFEVNNMEQEYRHDRRYKYILILFIKGQAKFDRTYSTSSPLNPGHRVVLAPEKAFTVTYIAHVTYTESDVPKLIRPTTFVHAGVVMETGQHLSPAELNELGFMITDKVVPYTIH